MKSIRIPAGSTDEEISKYCRSYTAELKLEIAKPHQFYHLDGTIKSLIHLYCTDESSPFRSIKHSTRIRDYQPSLRIIEDTVGEKRIDMLKGSDFKRWHTN